MIYAAFGNWAFAIYLAGCFTAMVLAFRSPVGNRLLPQTYGAWIASAFAIHHFMIPNAAHTWHYWWYIWNAAIAGFTVVIAYMAKDAGSRKQVFWLGVAAAINCLIYAAFSANGHPLPGIYYFYIGHACEATQVASMIIWSGPVVPVLKKLQKIIFHTRIGPWMQFIRL
jgi:hypothetical protein